MEPENPGGFPSAQTTRKDTEEISFFFFDRGERGQTEGDPTFGERRTLKYGIN